MQITGWFHSSGARIAFALKVLLLMAILPLSPLLNAQSFYGSIVGIVMDSSGAVLPAATVVLTNVGTNEKQTVQTDAAGKYSFVNLIPNDYSVEVTKSSFKRFVRANVPVQVGGVVRIDPSLAIGNVTETVNVSTDVPLLKTDSSSLSTEISGTEVQETPLNGRNVMNLIALAPGVVPTGAAMGGTGLNQGSRTAGGVGWGNYEIGGAIQGQSAQFLDGVANNLLGNNPVAIVPTQDAVQEFSVASSNATADFGRFAGGVVNMATKSGSNRFHGSAWEYLRNRDFNANDFFSNLNGLARPQFNQNQYGASVNGPIKKDKAFFMFTWEGFKAATGNLTPANVPTASMQSGIIQNFISDPINCPNPSNSSTCHSLTFYSDSSATTQVTPNATGSNVVATKINPAYFDPTTKVMKNFYPNPNQPNNTASNWVKTTPLGNKQNQYNGRVDYSLSQKQRLFARYTYWTLQDTPHSEFLDQGQPGTGPWPTNDGQVTTKTHQAVLGDTYSFNPTTVLDVRVDYVRQTSPNAAQGTNVNEAQFGANYAALAPQMGLHSMPGFQANGGYQLYNMGNYPNDGINWNNTYGISANIIKILGAHSLKFGAEVRLMDSSSVGFNGGGAGTQQYQNNFSGDEWANFLLGYPSQIKFNTAAETADYTYYQGYYATDTWQATRNLTLNLGLRYELPGALAERNNRDTVLLPNAVDPYTGITGTEALVASPLYSRRTTVIPEYNLFAPRLGFAYRATETTVFHGGYGISYLPNDMTGTLSNGSPVNSNTTQINIPGGGNPIQLQTALGCLVAASTACTKLGIQPGIQPPPQRSNPAFMTQFGSKTTYLGQQISGPVPNQPYPYVQQWNVALSHIFKANWMGEVSYSGLKGTNLPQGAQGGRVLDQLGDQYDSMGAALLNPAASCAAAPALANSNPSLSQITVGQCLRPFPYYNLVQDSAAYFAIENYRSIQVKAEKRMGAAGTLKANYTWAQNKSDTDTQTDYLESKSTKQGGSGSGGIQDYNNLAAEYSLISYDVTNRVIINYVVNLPFGKGKKFANNFAAPLDAVVSGWELSGISTFQSGFPVFLSEATQNQLNQNFGAGNTRPSVVPGCKPVIGGSGLRRAQTGNWFNFNCFTYAGDWTFGNEPRVDPEIRSDGQKNVDFSLQKSTKLFESANLQFRAEFFNALNRVQFAPPGNTIGSGNVGTISYQVNAPRQIQLSLRVNY